jgi:hypothetical protein
MKDDSNKILYIVLPKSTHHPINKKLRYWAGLDVYLFNETISTAPSF